MTSTNNLRILLAAGLFGAATFGGLLLAAPVRADYGATPVYNDGVCDGRYDPNCLIKETNYLNSQSYGYGSSYTYNNYNRNNYSNYSYHQQPVYVPYVAPYNYTSYTPSYSYNSYSYNTPYQYSYNYEYQYQYQTPTYQYNSYPAYSNTYQYGY